MKNKTTVSVKRNTHLIPFFFGSLGGGGGEIHVVSYVMWIFGPPSPRGGHNKFGIKCAFLLTQTVLKYLMGSSKFFTPFMISNGIAPRAKLRQWMNRDYVLHSLTIHVWHFPILVYARNFFETVTSGVCSFANSWTAGSTIIYYVLQSGKCN